MVRKCENKGCGLNVIWANGSVGKKKGGDTTTRTEIETAGLRDLGKIWVSGFGPWEPAAAKQHPVFACLGVKKDTAPEWNMLATLINILEKTLTGNAQPQRYQAHATHNYPAMRGYFTNEVPIRALALTSARWHDVRS